LLRGKFGEDAACEFLKHNGYKIIRRNWRVKHREIDIIAVEKCSSVIVFVEVKFRNSDSYIPGYFAVSKRKRAILRSACFEFLKRFCEESVPYRFDIIDISYNEVTETKNIHHYENVPLF
jgi:putative endonuclease